MWNVPWYVIVGLVVALAVFIRFFVWLSEKRERRSSQLVKPVVVIPKVEEQIRQAEVESQLLLKRIREDSLQGSFCGGSSVIEEEDFDDGLEDEIERLENELDAAYERRQASELGVSSLLPVAITFIVTGIVISFGLSVMKEVGAGSQVYNTTTETSQDNQMIGMLPVLGTVITASIVIGVLVRGFAL